MKTMENKGEQTPGGNAKTVASPRRPRMGVFKVQKTSAGRAADQKWSLRQEALVKAAGLEMERREAMGEFEDMNA